jgi:hypothetical protein
VNRGRLLDRMLIESLLRPANPALAWLVSRLGARAIQERVIRFWNRHGELPKGLARLPRRAPAAELLNAA